MLVKNIFSLLLFTFSLAAFGAGSVSGWEAEVVSMMDKKKLEAIYGYPYEVGEQDKETLVWPLYKQEVTGLNLVGYLYESIDFSSIPGFMGVPYNLLVAIDTKGSFIDARVLYHREPMFMGGIGEQPMLEFIEQYKGLSLMQNIKFSAKQGKKKHSDNKNIYLDGVSGATASIRILNQTLLSSGLKVARAKLGFGTRKDPDLIAKINDAVFHQLSWQQLVDAGLIKKAVFTNREAEALFKGTRAEGRDNIANREPDNTFIELYVMDVAIPSVGRNILTPEAWQFLQDNLDTGDHAILAISSGRHSFTYDTFLRGGISDRLLLRQEGLPIEMRDLDFNDRLGLEQKQTLHLPPYLQQADWMIYRVIATAGLDIALPLAFELAVIRGEAEVYAQAVTKSFSFNYKIPKAYFYEPESGNKTWKSIWTDRLPDIVILITAIFILFFVLLKPRMLTKNKRHFELFRNAYLLFTLLFIGWYAQGQLSIVNITGAIQSLMAGGGLRFFLYDPITMILWILLLLTFILWGRGTFCGWLCPFGALQELLTKIASFFKLPQYKLPTVWDKRFKNIKYLLLLITLAAAFLSPAWTDRLVEIEPFKTSITFYFVRSWPFVLWACALILLSFFVYKGYCRYLCPLGGAMALLGKTRLFNWLPRRQECGSPCQLCKNHCEYNAITPKGEIEYDECFQCLDCVVIYESDELCAPELIKKRKRTKESEINIIATSHA